MQRHDMIAVSDHDMIAVSDNRALMQIMENTLFCIV